MASPVDYSALKIEYPDLPVVQKREEFLGLLKTHQVIIVKADTGSGKSTQLPKFLLESGLASEGRIGVTQPRRLAALSIADRLREELKDESLVATRIRFLEEGPATAPIKVMTDGILLQEFRRDRLFKQYSAIMIDEAHERSLNIDILLGIFKHVVLKRPDFHLIVASATLDAKLFEAFYDNACVLEAEGRMFPVEVVYRDPQLDPAKTKGDSGLVEEARDAILDLMTLVGKDNLLCFLPTERDIQDLAAELKPELDEKSFDILPLFGRMSPAEQRRVFHSTGKTRVVLATNIAETSLTIPGIAYVVDTGSARVSRYNPQSRIQGLPIEEISQASARQRMGRAGRVKPGFCVRLYSEESYNEREEFTEPEIRRSNLANVVLQLRSLGLAIEEFPFLQAPPRSAFRGAYKTLHELGALTHGEQGADVTALGEEMARLPMDVALSAVLLRARDAGVLQPAIIVCAGLSIQDPRLFPSEDPDRQKARDCHRKLGGHKSDFLTYLAVWNSFNREWKGGSWNVLRKFCEKNWLHFMRCREWIDLYEQFARILKVDFKDRVCGFDAFHRDNLHIALLSGFLGGVARRDIENGCYRLVGGRESHVFPGSDLFGKSVEWLFSAEVRETSRVFLTKACEIKPEWIIQVAGSFCTRRWYEPRWNPERGFVEAVEEVTFRSMVLTRGRRVDYGRVNPEDCAQIFFRDAVVMGDMPRPFPFMEYNNRVVEGLRGLEARQRRWGLAPSEDAQVQYLVGKAPRVNSLKTLRDFIEKHTDNVLRFDAEAWIKASGTGVEHLESFQNGPQILPHSASKKKTESEPVHGGTVEYFRLCSREIRGELVFDASKEWDGISLEIPMDMVPRLTPAMLASHIGKWRDWMEDSFIRELPKTLRKKGEQQKEKMDDRFCELLDLRPNEAPLVLLYETFANFKDFAENTSVLNPDKEHHLRLHLTLIQKFKNQTFSLELSPEWGVFQWFEALRPMVVGASLDLPVGPYRFGWRLGKTVAMFPEESFFWQDFLHRVESSIPKPYELILEDRLSFLELGVAKVSSDDSTAPREWVLKSLLADGDIHENRPRTARDLESVLDRFSGLEFSHGKKIHHFKELSQVTGDIENQVRTGLVQLVWESGLLGLPFFIRGWSILRESMAQWRCQKPIREDYQKIALTLLSCSSLYKRLVWIARFWNADVDHLENIPEMLPLVKGKELRERFRPFLNGRFLKDFELKTARDLLTRLEHFAGDSETYFELWVQAEGLLERFSLLRYKRGFLASASEEVIEVGALAKLKGQFGRL